MSTPTHEGMTFEEINTCRCGECVRANAAIQIGVSLAEIGSALEWLPAHVEHTGHDRATYAAVLHFVADFHALQARLLGGDAR